MRVFFVLLGVFCALLFFVAQESSTSAVFDAPVTGDFGDPLPLLTEVELSQFELGRSVFARRFRRRDGLGPHFNATSCTSCHEDPAVGGSSQRYRDFFLAGRIEDDVLVKFYDDCTEENVDSHRTELCLPSIVIPHYGPPGSIANPLSREVAHPPIPPEATVVARRNAPPLFGVGLFRLVSDEEILSRADPNDLDGDGISGRVNIIASEDNQIGRFGYKCQTASIEAFNRGALHNQMGITSDSLEVAVVTPQDDGRPTLVERAFATRVAHAQAANPIDRIFDFDDAFDPEIAPSQLAALVSFQENLAAPRRGEVTPTVERGEVLFNEIGCADCHVASLDTTLGLIHPYTDLLLHNMGEELADGVIMDGARGDEFRTQPLWGLCEHPPFLHDGRADTVEEAVLIHGGEALEARNKFSALDEIESQELLRFLGSL